MTFFQAIVLGLVEGVTEFLPVSSTAHLLVAERLMGNVVPSIFFNTVVQLGALGAVIVYFHTRIIVLVRDSIEYLNKAMAGEIKPSPSSLPTGINILVASLPIFLVGFIFRNQIEGLHNSMLVISMSSIFVAIFLWYGQRISKKDPKSRVVVVLLWSEA
jgi:undecaprenyl-diphosphatase